MSWYQKKGRWTALVAPSRTQEIGESLHRQATIEAAIRAEEFRCEGRRLFAELDRVNADLRALPARTGASVELQFLRGLFWVGVGMGLIVANIGLVLWALKAFQVGPEAWLIALVVAGAGAIAVEQFLSLLKRIIPERSFRIWTTFGALAALSMLLAAALLLGVVRGNFLATQGVVNAGNAPVVETVEASSAPTPEIATSAVETFYRKAGRTAVAVMGLMALGLEYTAGLALHWGLAWLSVAWVILGLQRRRRGLEQELAGLSAAIQEIERQPEIMRLEFDRGAALVEGIRERNRERPGRLVGMGLLAFLLILVLLLFVFIHSAVAAEVVVVGLDLTASTPKEEFQQDLLMVERVIDGLGAGDRVVVLGMTGSSFAESVLLDARLSEDPGLFGERVRAGRGVLVQQWRKVAKTLQPAAKQSDVCGLFGKAAVVFTDHPGEEHRLIVLSDMRHVGRGFDFERMTVIEDRTLEAVAAAGLIPDLRGVKVWVLGAHTDGVSEQYWTSLKVFWAAYLQKAGAELVVFSSRRILPVLAGK